MNNITVTYIGGGSRAWAQKYFCDFLLQDKINGVIRLYDIDTESACNNKKYFDCLVNSHKDKLKSNWECIVYNSLDEALFGTDFVIISILPGHIEMMINDVHYSEKHNINFTVGDTIGVAGMSRALRTIPIFIEFANKIKEICPNAWVINYTNPMAMCTYTLFKQFDKIKAFGCCHEVFGTKDMIIAVLESYYALSKEGQDKYLNSDYKGVIKEAKDKKINVFKALHSDKLKPKYIKRNEIEANVQGINHFTFIDKLSYKDNDVMPIIKAFVELKNIRDNKLWFRLLGPLRFFWNKNTVKLSFLKDKGILAAAGDRHLVEFLDEHEYLKNKNSFKYGFAYTPVKNRIRNYKKKNKYINDVINHNKIPYLSKSGEEGIYQIQALMGLNEFTTNVNYINIGQAPSLPLGAVVESNALFCKYKIVPINMGEIKEDVNKIINKHCKLQKEFVDAYFTYDKEKVFEVFRTDSKVKALTIEQARQLFNDLISLNKDSLNQFLL